MCISEFSKIEHREKPQPEKKNLAIILITWLLF